MTEPLPFEDYNVAIAGDPDFATAVEKACWRIAGVETYRVTEVNGWALEAVDPDLVVLAGYMARVPDDLLELYTVIGFHPSLLPRYRGGSAVKWQLHENEDDLGVSVYRLTPGRMDAGPVVVQRRLRAVAPSDRRPGALYRIMRDEGVLALSAAVAAYARGTYTETPQDERLATWHPALLPGQRPEDYDHGQHQADPRQGAA